MQGKRNYLKESIKEYISNIGSLQAINIIYITFIFFFFLLGFLFLGLGALFIAMFFLPMLSIGLNYVARKLLTKQEINVNDIFIAKRVKLPSFIQYYSIYKKSILWAMLSFIICNFVCSYIYLSNSGIMENLMSAGSNFDDFYESFINDESFLKFSLVSEFISLICSYFVFSITRQKYQFAPIILNNCPMKLQGAINYSKKVYSQNSKTINKGNLLLLLWWLFAFFISMIFMFIVNKNYLMNFELSFIIAFFIFLFIGSFSISIKVIYKNILYIELLSSQINDINEKYFINRKD